MKKIFSEAEVELTLLSAFDDILLESLLEGEGGGLYGEDEDPSIWDED